MKSYARFIVSLLLFMMMILYSFDIYLYPDQYSPGVPAGDPATYLNLAEDLLEHGAYAERWPEGDVFRAWRPPFYPYFLAGLIIMTQGSLRGVIFFQLFLANLSGILVFLLARELSEMHAAPVVAAMLYFLFFPLKHLALITMSETLFIFLMLFAVYFSIRAFEMTNNYYPVYASIALTFCLLTRTVMLPAVVLLYVILAIFLFFRFRFIPGKEELVRKLALFFGVQVLILAVWAIRNYLVLEEFVLINTSNGMNLWVGTLTGYDWGEIHAEVINPLRDMYGEVGSMKKLTDLAISNISSNPVEYLKLKAGTVINYLLIWGKGTRIQQIASAGFLGAMLLNLLHCMTHWSQKRWQEIAVIILFFSLLGSITLAFYRPRFGYVVFPLYAIVVSKGLEAFIGIGQRFLSG